ncbi:metallophosphoesterase [bacterium]|nr:metallophosphoesterase [bacterium]
MAFFLFSRLAGMMCGILVLFLCVGLNEAVAAIESRDLRILVTSDMHGWMSTAWMYPNEKRKGLLHIAEGIRRARSETPDSVLLDAGDLLQGSPLVSFFHQKKKSAAVEDPFFRLVQSLGYDAIVVGNHDLGFNPQFEREYFPRSRFPWLAANIYRNSRLVFKPFITLFPNGIKTVILGFSTPGTQMWIGPDRLNGIEISSIESSAAYWLNIIKREEKPDLIIGVFHAGVYPVRDDENSKINRISATNAVLRTLKQNSGFDLVIAGHDHRLSPGMFGTHIEYFRDTPIIEGGRWGQAFVDLRLKLERSGQKWRISDIEHQIHQASQNRKIEADYMSGLPADYKAYMKASLPYRFDRIPDRKSASACLNLLNALAQDEPSIAGTILPELSISRMSDLLGKEVRRLELYQWFRHDNRTVTVLMSLRDIQLLSEPVPEFGYRRIPYNRKLSVHLRKFIPKPEKGTWWLKRDLFERNYPIKISDYHYSGGGGSISQIFLPITGRVRISEMTIRDRFFQYMLQKGPELPDVCRFLTYTGF